MRSAIFTAASLAVILVWAARVVTAHYFLERREIGMFNIGKDSTGIVVADGVKYELGYKDCLYITPVSYTHLPQLTAVVGADIALVAAVMVGAQDLDDAGLAAAVAVGSLGEVTVLEVMDVTPVSYTHLKRLRYGNCVPITTISEVGQKNLIPPRWK